MRLGDAGTGVDGLLRSFEGNRFNGLALLVTLGTVWEHRFDATLPSVLQFSQIQRLASSNEIVSFGGLTNLTDLNQIRH